MIIIHKGKKIVEGKVPELLDPSKSLVQLETVDNVAAREKLLQTKWAASLQNNTVKLQLKMNKEDVPAIQKYFPQWEVVQYMPLTGTFGRSNAFIGRLFSFTYNPARPCGIFCKLNCLKYLRNQELTWHLPL